MDLSLPLQILGVLLAIFFIVTLVLGAKTWKWFHITFAFFVFCAAGTFAAYAAMSLATRTNWSKAVKALEADNDRLEKQVVALRNGDIEKPDDGASNVRNLTKELNKLYLHRGRVWRNCTLAEINAQQARLKFVTQAPAAPAADAAAAAPDAGPNRIEAKAILYLFKDQTVDNVFRPGEQRVVPAIFVGEVTAVEVTDGDVTVTPTLPLDRWQASHLVADGVTWTIYEMMPIDSHEALGGLNEAQLQAVMPNNLQLPAPVYQELVQRFVRDGQVPLESDPAEHRWVRVKFLAKHSVTVDSPTTQVERDSKYFDDQGQALLANLRAGKAIEFEKGQEAVFHQQRADELISSGVCEKIADVYRRPLNDFAQHFHEISQRVAYLEDRIKEVQRQTAVLVEAKEKVTAQIDYRTKEKAKLEQDLAKFREEQSRITAYRKRIEAVIEVTNSRVAEAEKQCLELAEQLAENQRRMAEEIDKRTLPSAPGAKPSSTTTPTSTTKVERADSDDRAARLARTGAR